MAAFLHRMAQVAGWLCGVMRQKLRPTVEEALLHSLLDNPLDGIITIDDHGIIQTFNSAAERLFGYTAEEVHGRNVSLLMPEPHRGRHDGYIAEYLHTGRSRIIGIGREVQGQRKDGSVFLMELAITEYRWQGRRYFAGIVRDISQRKRTEEELQASQRLLQTAFETIPHPVFVKDPQGRYLVVNHAWCERYRCTPEQALGRLTREVPGRSLGDKLRAEEEDRQVMHVQRRPLFFEGTDTTRDGQTLHFHSYKAPLFDGAGNVTGLVGVVVDTTELHRRAEEARDSQLLLRTVMDVLPHYLVVKDLQGRYLMVNKAWCEAFGRTPEEVLGRHMKEIEGRPADEVERILAEDQKVYAGEQVRIPISRQLTIKSGEKRFFEGIKVPLRDTQGAVSGLVGIAMDVTERVEAGHKADLAYARLFDAIESLPAAFMMFDARERLVLWNDRVGDLYPDLFPLLRQGLPYEDVARVAIATAVVMVENDLETELRNRMAEFHGQTGTFEYRLKDGRYIQGIDRRTSDGGTVCLRFDVTADKQREAELRQSQKLEAIGSLAGGIAHDFNNMLTVISSYADFIVRKPGDMERVQADAQVIRETAGRAAALTRQLLAFSRRQVLMMRTLDINRTIATMEKMLRRLIGEHIELHSTLDPALHPVLADETQIEQIILNLAINARDAMPQGGQLLIETANRRFDEANAAAHTALVPGDYVMLAVTDTGGGMDAATKKHIFEPFFTTKPTGQGTGLGLATVYGIVRQMNGFIFVESEPGKGSSFYIYFPRSAVQTVAESRPVETTVDIPATETVLLVEDEDAVRASAARILTGAGYTVLQAATPQQALDLLAGHAGTVHLLLSDVVMPGMSGPELWRRARAYRPLQVLFMSGYADHAAIRDGGLEEGVPFLQKPFSQQSLLTRVRAVLAAGSQNAISPV